MTRPLVLSNGSLHVGVNLYGMVHDFYFPYVGQENHATANNMRWRVGVWTESHFSWLDDGQWEFNFHYANNLLIEETIASNSQLGITLEIHGCVATEHNAFIREIKVINNFDRPREVRLFLHQVMRINNSLNGDTVQYLPNESAILQYKAKRVFMFGGQHADGRTFDQYSVGVYGIEGKEGTWRDAEDGLLASNNVEHGSVDSVIGFTLQLDSGQTTIVSYWVTAGHDFHETVSCFKKIRQEGVRAHLQKTADYWRHWLHPADTFCDQIEPELREPFRRSLLILKAHIDGHGGVVASTDTTVRNYSRDAYAYCWPRDGALSLWPLLRLGYFDEVKNFFYFCRKGLQPEGYLMHKYLSNGAPGSSWHPYYASGRVIPPIQEDETAIVIFLFGQYYQMTENRQLLGEFYDSLIRPAANFFANYIDDATKLPHATYDIWEEKLLTTTYTTAVTYAALLAAAHLAEVMGRPHESVQWQAVADDIHDAGKELLYNKDKQYFYKGFIRTQGPDGKKEAVYDDTIDLSSFYGAFMFGLFDLDSEEIKQSFKTLQARFLINDTAVTPVPRYEGDWYRRVQGGDLDNPWFITTLWIAQYYMEIGKLDQAKAIINWVRDSMLSTGVLSEQINPYTRKFLSVAPLTWSQAEFINSIIDLVSDPMKQATG